MIVLNLRCGGGHLFEGWFSSTEDFDAQCERQDVLCPTCNSSKIDRVPSAPRIIRSQGPSGRGETDRAGTDRGETNELASSLADKLLHALTSLAASAEDVSTRFAEEARKIHYGEAEARQIKGVATLEETQNLLDEGIPVLPVLNTKPIH